MNKKILLCGVLWIIGFFCLFPSVSVMTVSAKVIPPLDSPRSSGIDVDVPYMYNITVALSNIIFTEYNESHGEIAKGRAFGTKGEHKAAQILYENMTQLGLITTLQPLGKRPDVSNDELNTQLEVLNYTVKFNGRCLDCFMAGSWKGSHDQPNQLNTTFSYNGLKVKPMPMFPGFYNRTLAKETEDFVILGRDQWNDPNGTLPVIDLLKPFLDPLKFYMKFHITSLFNIQRETAVWYQWYPHCRGLLLYDFNIECHDMVYFLKNGNSLPVIFITGNDGKQMMEHLSESIVDMELTQRFNTSVISYNVIGELVGTEKNNTIILSCLYDGWWNQGTADSAIGMAIVLGVAKYFIDASITPKYTLKFIGFSGEEFNLRGAQYYDAIYKDENILAVVDLNQVGFTQNNPRLTFDIVANRYLFLQQVWNVMKLSNYGERIGNVTDIKPIWWASGNIPGNAGAFALSRPLCKAMSIFKDGGWILHHRDGKNHTEGDVLKYFNWTDTQVTAEMVTNLTKALAMGQTGTVYFTPDLQILNSFLVKDHRE